MDTRKLHPAHGMTWASYVEGLVPLGEHLRRLLPDPNDALLEQELYRHIYLVLSQGFGGLVYQNATHPDFWPQFSTMYNFAISNVDDTYHMTPLDAAGVYKIAGFRGSAHAVDFQIGSEHFFYSGLGRLGPPLSNFDLDHEVNIAANGAFEFILSGAKPADYQGDWLPLHPSGTHLLVRQVFYDWDKEVTGRFAIERLDTPAARPRDSAAMIAAQLGSIVTAARNWAEFALGHTKNLRDRGVINQMSVRDFSQSGGVSTQIYMDGLYDLKDGEALILEVEIPQDCFYWSFVIYDELWSVVDWLNRQVSINGHTAHIDDDGIFRAVIAAEDPGISNWLDTAGYARGGIFGRFNRCPGELKPVMKKIKLADLPGHLPAGTPSISLAQRDERIRVRRRAIQLRSRW